MSAQMDYEIVSQAQPLSAKPVKVEVPAKMTMGDRGVNVTDSDAGVDVDATTDDEENWWKKPAPGK
jgi:hypothetical protein